MNIISRHPSPTDDKKTLKSQISKLESGYDNISLNVISKVFNALNAKIKISIELEEGSQLELA